VRDFFTALQSQTVTTGMPELMAPIGNNRVLVLFRGGVVGRASGRSLQGATVCHISTLNEQYKTTHFEDWCDTGSIKAVIDGTVGVQQPRTIFGEDGY